MCATRTTSPSSRLGRSVALGVTCCALVIAGCASSAGSSGTGTSGSGSYAQGVKYSDCMRSHGVPNFPDPGAGGGVSRQSSGNNPRSPAYQSAQKVCASLNPEGGSSTPPPISAAQRAGMIANARCIRAHGVPRFPDPRFGSGDAIEIGVVPNEANSPAFKRAVKTCEHVGILVPGVGVG